MPTRLVDCERRFGCAAARVVALDAVLYIPGRRAGASYYIGSRATAQGRGIEWRFTYPTWAQVWLDSGKWSQRGHGGALDGYCMSRFNDCGPYAPENVFIQTVGGNTQDARAIARALAVPQWRRLVADLACYGSAAA